MILSTNLATPLSFDFYFDRGCRSPYNKYECDISLFYMHAIKGECSAGGVSFAFFVHGIAIAKFLPVTGECFNQTVKITP